MRVKCMLYKLAIWYIGNCNNKWNIKTEKIKTFKRLTYRNGGKAYLKCGSDKEWKNFSRYDVLDNAIQKLAKYEDDELS